MPIYGYRCQSCQREFETQQPMSDPPEAACPECGGAGTRLFYPTGILFKGSGFYKTDSRSAPAAAPVPNAAAAKPATDGAAAGAGESTKPAAPSKESASPAAAPKSGETSKPSPASDSPTR